MSAAKKLKSRASKKNKNAIHRHAHAAKLGGMNRDQVRLAFGLVLSAIFMAAMYSELTFGVSPELFDVMPKF